MVYNVFDKEFRMGTYDESLKLMHALDSAKKEMNGYIYLMSKLIPQGEYDGNDYVVHQDTGIVYDLKIIHNNIQRLEDKIIDIESHSNKNS